MSKTRLFLYSGLVMLALSIGAFVTAQTEFETVSVLFFDSCKECIEIDRISEKGFEYGYRIEHGTWAEEHYWYGETKSNAVTAFANEEVI